MSLEGCSHGPTFVTGGPENCHECAKDAEASQAALERLATMSDLELVEYVVDGTNKPTDGPWYVSADDASDCPDHQGSGLAMIDTGRSADWPIARLCEWNNVYLLAAAPDLLAALIFAQKYSAMPGHAFPAQLISVVNKAIAKARGQQ